MAALGELVVQLSVDSTAFSRGLDTAAGKLKSVGDSMSAIGRTMSVAVTVPLVAAGGAALKLAVDAEETASKFNTVLGPAAAEVNARIAELQQTIPATRQELQNSIADFTALGKATGLTAAQALELADGFTVAAADLGSFNNVPTAEAIAAIRSAMVGASEPLLRFGVDTRVAALEAKALELGLIQEGEAMDAATRATTILAQIHANASDAMGDAARTAESTANSMKFLKAGIVDLATDIGQELIPIIRPMLAQIKEWLERFSDMDDGTKKVIVVVGLLVAAIGPLLLIGGTLISAIGGIITVLGAVSAPVAAVVAAIGVLVAALVTAYAKSETFRDIVNGAFRAVMETVKPILEELQQTVQVVLAAIQRFWQEHGETIMSIVEPAMKLILAVIEAVMKTMGEAVKLVLNLIQGDWDGALKNITAMNEIFKEALLKIFDALKNLLVAIVKAMWESIKQQFVDAINGIKDLVGKFTNDVKEKFEALADAITFGSLWPDMWDSIAGQTEEWTGVIDGIMDDWVNGLLGLFDKLSGGLISKVMNMWKTITGIIGNIGGIIDTIGGLFGSAGVAGVGGAGAGVIGSGAGMGIGLSGGGAGAVGVGGTAGTAGGAGSLGGLAGGLAGAGIATFGTVGFSFLAEGLANLLGMGDNYHQRTIEWMHRVQDADEAWRERIENQTGAGAWQVGYQDTTVVLEVDGYKLGQVALKYGVDGIRQQTGIEAY